MELTFVDIFEKEGLDAPVESFATAFAHAGFRLWHANQAARYNILNGIMPPESGHWKNNMHADDIDFQIEADFAGLMAPGMVNAAGIYADRIGHIMNYGDGFYGGAYVAAMYSLAYVYDDVYQLVIDALEMAVTHRNPLAGLMFHSDRGVQYASKSFRRKLKSFEMVQSMSRKGNCWDNACAESFFSTLKMEEVFHKKYRTKEEARKSIFEYVAVFYNRQRSHSYLDYLSPADYEELEIKKVA